MLSKGRNGLNVMTNQTRSRAITYGAIGVLLLGGYAVLSGSNWRGAVELHTLMEAVATVMAGFVGAVALLRHYAQPNTTIFLIGAGFTTSALFDLFHTIVTAVAVVPYLPSDLVALTPWSWLFSRTFLSFMLMLSWIAWHQEKTPGKASLYSGPRVLVCVLVISACSVVIFWFIPLKSGYYTDNVFPRPQEFIPLILLFAALVGFLRQGYWKTNPFEHWLIISLVVAIIGQVIMAGSTQLYDMAFDAAHLLKIVSYFCVLVGLLVSVRLVYREAEETGQRYRAVFDSAVDSVVTIDQSGIMESFNPAAEMIFGYSAEECIGQNVRMLMPDPDRSAHDGYLGNYLDTGQAKIIGIGREVVGLHKNGREFPMDLSVGQFRLGNQIMFVGICRDVTARRREQDEIAAVNKELESFSYSVSHDLRSPLRAIDGFSQALLEDYGDKIGEDGLGYISRVRGGAQRMGRLIDDLLNLSRVTRRELVREPVNLSELVTQIADDLRTGDPERQVVFEIDPGLRTRGDSHLLKIALENLLGNAWKYTAGQEKAHIAFTSEIDGSMRNFIIRDNGAGFNQEYANKLFEPFQRLHTLREFDGSGIGLATVARIIHRHGGKIWGEGVVGEGAAFYFRISA